MSELTVKVREVPNAVVLDFSGKITIGEGASLFRDQIREMLDSGHKNILVNFESVSYVDSAGLGQLVGCFATAAHRGGQIKLLNVGHRIGELLHITHLDSVFQVFANERVALHSFNDD